MMVFSVYLSFPDFGVASDSCWFFSFLAVNWEEDCLSCPSLSLPTSRGAVVINRHGMMSVSHSFSLILLTTLRTRDRESVIIFWSKISFFLVSGDPLWRKDVGIFIRRLLRTRKVQEGSLERRAIVLLSIKWDLLPPSCFQVKSRLHCLLGDD